MVGPPEGCLWEGVMCWLHVSVFLYWLLVESSCFLKCPAVWKLNKDLENLQRSKLSQSLFCGSELPRDGRAVCVPGHHTRCFTCTPGIWTWEYQCFLSQIPKIAHYLNIYLHGGICQCDHKPMQRQGLFCSCMMLTVPCNSCFAKRVVV